MTTVFHTIILSIFFVIIYILFGIIWLVDRIYILAHRISNACPNPDCQAHFLIPAYICPNCHRVHTRLVPGRYGILKRRCLCGEKLPTTFLNGRSKLQAYCPVCGSSLTGDTGSRQYAIPIIGGPDVGKTCLINMGVKTLLQDVAPQSGWDLSFMSESDKAEYFSVVQGMLKGVRPMKTDKDALTAYQLMLNLPNDKIGRRIYIYDISGEMFSNSGDIQRNKAFSYADGFIFLIDPLTIPDFSMKVSDKVNFDSYGASSKDFDDIFDVMLNNLQIMFNMKPEDVMKKNLAVVINKCDIPTLNEQIGPAAAESYMAANPDCKSEGDAENELVRSFLEENGEGNFVRTAEARFRNVRYFACSALGHNKEGVTFQGYGTEAPFLWILEEIDPKIRATVR